MNDTTKVWASHSRIESRIMLPIRIMPSDPGERDLGSGELDHWAAVSAEYRMGGVLDASTLPIRFAGRKKDTTIDRLPDFFIGGGFLMVSQRSADVFARHEFGHGGISPIEIYQGDRISPVSTDPYYILNIASLKTALMPELCNPVAFCQKIITKYGVERYSEVDLRDGDCVLNTNALEGSDLWLDSAVSNSFFVSSQLADELSRANLVENMFLRRCRVVDR